jgi:hypothetical protein
MSKKLTTIYLAFVQLLGLACVSGASLLTVNAPPGAPSWWDTASASYVYAWWEDTSVMPPSDATNWASNYLQNTAFTAGNQNGVEPWMGLQFGNLGDPYYEVYIYISGESDNNPAIDPTLVSFSIGGSTFSGSQVASGSIIDGEEYWSYVLSGTINSLPTYLYLQISENAIMEPVSMWVGVSSVPEPVTITLFSLGGLVLLRKRTQA